jgi:hypothetical protein
MDGSSDRTLTSVSMFHTKTNVQAWHLTSICAAVLVWRLSYLAHTFPRGSLGTTLARSRSFHWRAREEMFCKIFCMKHLWNHNILALQEFWNWACNSCMYWCHSATPPTFSYITPCSNASFLATRQFHAPVIHMKNQVYCRSNYVKRIGFTLTSGGRPTFFGSVANHLLKELQNGD